MVKNVFMPAAWLTAHGYSIDDVSVALDQLSDEHLSEIQMQLMLDCADDAAYFRAVGVYQMFEWSVLCARSSSGRRTRNRLPADGSMTEMGHVCRRLLSKTKLYLHRSRPFCTRTTLTSTRIKHVDNARKHGLAACGAAYTLAFAARERDRDLYETLHRVSCRLLEGVRQIELYRALLDVRMRFGWHAAAKDGDAPEPMIGAMLPTPSDAFGDVGLASVLKDMGIMPEELEALARDVDVVTGDDAMDDYSEDDEVVAL